jgi:S-adenosylmethionine:tRNA ribosyltransferase-isomerase
VIAAARPERKAGKLLVVDADGGLRHLARTELSRLFRAGDLVVANDAATLPASLAGTHAPTGAPIEVRLAGWAAPGDPTRFVAVIFGSGDHRSRTEDRPTPPPLSPGDRLLLGALAATVERVLDHPRLVALSFAGEGHAVWAALARQGRPIQYSHVPEPLVLWDVWTTIAARPLAFEAPSAGFALDWRTLAAWRARGVRFATLTLATGISSTGDPELDRRFPLDEPYDIPPSTAAAIAAARRSGGRVIAIGTTVVRALEAAALDDGTLPSGEGMATGRIGPKTRLRVVEAILTGVHQPGESHYELLRAFVGDATLVRMTQVLEAGRYRAHEFGDSVLVERRRCQELSDHADDRSVAAVAGRAVAA